MKILKIDHEYYCFPENCPTIAEFIAYANDNYNRFVELTKLDTFNCTCPYFIREDIKTVYLNLGRVDSISEVEGTILCRADYESRLLQVIQEKCVHCRSFEEDAWGANFRGYRESISLDGECWQYVPAEKE